MLSKMETQEALSTIQLDEERKTTRNYEQIFRNVTHNINTLLEMSGEEYSDEMNAKAVKHIMGLKKNADSEEKSITQQAFQWLRKAKSDSKPKTKKPIMDSKHLEIRNMEWFLSLVLFLKQHLGAGKHTDHAERNHGDDCVSHVGASCT